MTFMGTWVWMKLTWLLRTMKSSLGQPLTPLESSLDKVASIVFSRNITKEQLLRYVLLFYEVHMFL